MTERGTSIVFPRGKEKQTARIFTELHREVGERDDIGHLSDLFFEIFLNHTEHRVRVREQQKSLDSFDTITPTHKEQKSVSQHMKEMTEDQSIEVYQRKRADPSKSILSIIQEVIK